MSPSETANALNAFILRTQRLLADLTIIIERNGKAIISSSILQPEQLEQFIHCSKSSAAAR
jgi:hypothetical protein